MEAYNKQMSTLEKEVTLLHKRIDAGLRAGIAEALEEHRRMGRSIAIWRDGRVQIIPASEIPSQSEAPASLNENSDDKC